MEWCNLKGNNTKITVATTDLQVKDKLLIQDNKYLKDNKTIQPKALMQQPVQRAACGSAIKNEKK